MNSANAIANGTVDAAPITGEQLEAAHAADMNLTSFEDTALGVMLQYEGQRLSKTPTYAPRF